MLIAIKFEMDHIVDVDVAPFNNPRYRFYNVG